MGTQKDHNTNSAKSLQSFSKQLQYSGVQVITVGDGDVPEDDLKNMATEPNYALRVKSLQTADEAGKVAKVMCHGKETKINAFLLSFFLCVLMVFCFSGKISFLS
jgi:hypothetical protein